MDQKAIYLKTYLHVFGVLNVGLLSFAPILLGDILLWQPRNIPVEMMLGSLYFAMGIVMLVASKQPLKHKSLVDFIILGNLLHALLMLFFAENVFHLVLDAGSIGLLGGIPLLIYPWGIRNFLRYE